MSFIKNSDQGKYVVVVGEYESTRPIASFDTPDDAREFGNFYDQHYAQSSSDEAEVRSIPHFGAGQVDKAIKSLSKRKR